MKTLLAAVALAIAALAPALAAAPVPYLPVPRGAAVLLNTGSTNALGYRVVIQSNGSVEYVQGSSRATAQIPAALASKFYAHLTAAMPLSRLHAAPCMKTTSFGTMTFLWWRGQRSLDVSCPGDAKATALNADAIAIAAALHLGNGHQVYLQPNEPRRPVPSAAPSGSPLSVRLTARAF